MPSRNVGNYQPMLRNLPEERRRQLLYPLNRTLARPEGHSGRYEGAKYDLPLSKFGSSIVQPVA